MNHTNATDNQPDTGLSWDDARDLLDEVREATTGSGQDRLHDLVCVVSRLADLQEVSDSEQRDEIADFVRRSLDEIRHLIDEGEGAESGLDHLYQEAIDRWGDQLPIKDVDDVDDQAEEVWHGGDDRPATSDDAQLVAPSAEAIESLLSSLGQSTPTDPPSAADSHQPAPSAKLAANPPRSANIDGARGAIEALDPEIREAFLDDASSCVSSMESALLQLENDPASVDSLNQICRDLHTLKGASASVGLSELADQLHALEDSIRNDQEAGRTPSIDELFRTIDSVRGQVSSEDALPATDNASQSDRPTDSRQPALIQTPPPSQLESLADGPADDEMVRVKSSQLNRLMDMLAELVMLRNRRETELGQLQDIYHELVGSVSKMRLISNEEPGQELASSSLQLSEVANDVLEVAQIVRDCAQPVAEGNAAVSQFIRQFRQELVGLRRTPISGLFRRLQRAVRDAAHAEGKRVQLQLVGEDAGIERSLQQRLYEPLLHIVRNSVGHGIESAEERERCGKEPAGTITLEARSTADLFVIEIRDDGRGLDYDAIRRRGIQRGLLADDQAVSDQELSQLIFQPGFSTRENADQIAGRGVGMNVVAATLQRMRGWIEVDCQSGQGTRIRLSFPLPSVIQHAMVFRSADQLYALPMQSVKKAGEREQNTLFLEFSQLSGDRGPAGNQRLGELQRIVLAGDGTDTAASVTLLVDEIVGPEEVVVRPLPRLLRHHPFCSGATLSGMGQTVLLLDARRIVDSQRRLLSQDDPAGDSQSSAEANRGLSRPRVLVVDDSLSARKHVVRSLQRFPVDVLEASDGRQALTLLKTEKVACVFSDMEMPHVSGMELLAEVNGYEDAPPVVIISSRSEEEFTERAKELGASAYLIKPLADEALDSVLSQITSLRHLVNTPSGEIR